MNESLNTGSASNQSSTPRTGRHGTRSKTGCSTCRTRKVKCDETKPRCRRCEKAQVACDWDGPVVRGRFSQKNRRPPHTHESTSTTEDNLSLDALLASDQQSADHENSARFTSASQTATTSPVALTVDSRSSQRPLTPGDTFPNPTLLNQDDLPSLEFLASSPMVLRFGKPWRWSMLFYVYSRVAKREKGVWKAFVAVVSMERRCHELAETQNSGRSTNSSREAQKFKDHASNALHLAILDLSEILNRLGTHPNNHDDLEAVFAMWFLILHFGIYDVDLVHTSYVHLNGIRAFLEDWFHGSSERQVNTLPPAAKQLLMFICYMDVTLALGGQGDGKLSTFLVDEPIDSPVSFNRLFEEMRVCVPQLWGLEYPAEELLDDIENYRPLKLLFSCQVLKLRTWQIGTDDTLASQFASGSGDLWEAIEELEKAYQDIILLAKSTPRTNGRRVIWTVYHAYLDFCGLKILYCCLPDTECRPPWLGDVLSDLLKVAHKALIEDPRHVYRYAWPLRMALFRLTDPIHCEWVQTQTTKASLLLTNLGIPANLPDSGASDETLFVSHPFSANTSPA